jgi:hypothetical protein
MKTTTIVRIDALDKIVRFDPRSSAARPGDGYGIGITGDNVAIWITIGDREVDVPVVADRLIEVLDAMRWQAMRRIAATSIDVEAVRDELTGNDNTSEVPAAIYCRCGHSNDAHDYVSRGGCTFCECARYQRFAAAHNAPA